MARSSYGLPLMRMLLDKREAGLVVFDVSEATMIAAASNEDCPQQMMELVINNADSEIPVNEKILSSAIGNVRAAESALEYLVKTRSSCTGLPSDREASGAKYCELTETDETI